MPGSDIVLGDESILLDTQWVTCTAHDFVLNSPERYDGDGNPRRALVHGAPGESPLGKDRLIINYKGDYPDGVWIGDKLYVQGVSSTGGKKEFGKITLAAIPMLKPLGDSGDAILNYTMEKMLEGKIQHNDYDYVDIIQEIKSLRLAVALLTEVINNMK